MRIPLCALALLGLVGCSAITPPKPPVDGDVATTQQTEVSLAAIKGSPTDYFYAGVADANKNCGDWLNQLALLAQHLKFYSNAGQLAGTGVSSALAATSAPGVASTLTAIFSGLFGNITNAYSDSQTGGMPPGPLTSLVESAQNTFLANLPPLTSTAQAEMMRTAYVRQCQPADIAKFINQALSTAKTAATPTPVSAAGRLGATPETVFAPPDVNVVR